MISEHPNELYICMKKTQNYNMLSEFVWKGSYQWKGFHTHPYIERVYRIFLASCFLRLSLTAAIAFEQFCIEFLKGV